MIARRCCPTTRRSSSRSWALSRLVLTPTQKSSDFHIKLQQQVIEKLQIGPFGDALTAQELATQLCEDKTEVKHVIHLLDSRGAICRTFPVDDSRKTIHPDIDRWTIADGFESDEYVKGENVHRSDVVGNHLEAMLVSVVSTGDDRAVNVKYVNLSEETKHDATNLGGLRPVQDVEARPVQDDEARGDEPRDPSRGSSTTA